MRTPTTSSSILLTSAILLTAALAAAQTAGKPASAYHLDDPANLAGERVSAPALADTLPINHGAAALQQLLLKLRTRASLMLIVAHPDDEDGGMLTYESRGQGARVAMLTLNRGEGGQNLMTGDFNDALGLIRTQELLAADRYMGVDQFFGSVVDFGFSKAREEALQQWGHDRVLYDAVRCVRLYRPLIVASVFVGGPTDGHGQHQVAGQMAQEVFNAAADPKVFPEMGLPPWAPMKVYARARGASNDPRGIYDVTTGQYQPARYMNYVTGVAASTPPPPAVIVHEGDVSTALGMNGDSYSQFARKGLALQKSQNGGGGGGRGGGGGGPVDAAYARYGSRVPNSPATENSFFDGVDTSLAGIATLAPSAPAALKAEIAAGLAKLDASTAEAQRLFSTNKPELTAPALRDTLRTLDALIAAVEKSIVDPAEKWDLLHELRIKRVQANNALVLALGITFDPRVDPSQSPVILPAPPPSDYHLKTVLHVEHTGTGKLEFLGFGPAWATKPLQPIPVAVGGNMPSDRAMTFPPFDKPIDSPIDQNLHTAYRPTRPYFFRADSEQPFYNFSENNLRNAPEAPAPFIHTAWFSYDGVVLSMSREEEAAGKPIVIDPALSVSLAPAAGIIPLAEKSFTVTAHIAGGRAIQGSLKLGLPAGWTSVPEHVDFQVSAPGSGQDFAFTITPANLKPGMRYSFLAAVKAESNNYTGAYRAVGYPGLTSTNYYTSATYRANAVDLHAAPNLRVAYLQGTGDDVPAYLPDIGITPTILALSDLTAEKLAQYDAVVLGIRAYSAHAELAGAGSKPLLDYAKNGGVVIVQYNNGRYGAEDAPYPITTPLASQDHAHDVVVEAQPVVVLAPDAPVLIWPNKITSADFDHWVEERGHGFAGTWAPEYQALLETHDPGQDPQKGGLLVARTGKGYYIYCGLALYRQLPEGVPGAYRLLANLLSVGKNPAAK